MTHVRVGHVYYYARIVFMNILKELRSTHGVISAERVVLTKEIQEILGKQLGAKARTNNRHVEVFSFHYRVNGHAVAGFALIPKRMKIPVPVIVYNRGGTGDFGLVKRGGMFVDLAEMARWGSAIIGSQYSGNVVSEGKEERGGSDVEDILVLLKLIEKLKFINKKKIGMYGASRGGMMTYRTLVRSSRVKTAVIVAGEADLVSAVKWRPEMKEVFVECFGGSMREMRLRSAVYWASKLPRKTPILLIHGTADDKVNYLDSLNMSHELQKYKIPHKLVLFEGGDHQLTDYKTDEQKLVRNWFGEFGFYE